MTALHCASDAAEEPATAPAAAQRARGMLQSADLRLGRRRQVDADRPAACGTPPTSTTISARRCSTLGAQPPAATASRSRFQPAARRPRAEREQGITIDIAWRYFETPRPPLRHHRQPRATSSTRATWRPAPRTPTSPSCSSMRVTASSARRAATPRILRPRRRQDAWCSPSTRWTWSTGREDALPRDRGRLPRAGRALRLPRGDHHSGCRR